jgi:pantoate--beta-alanine ligase
MQEVTAIAMLRAALAAERAAGRRIGLVPTMGYLHAGHLSLVETVRRECDVIVMSLFVNPLQFAPGEDFDRYPRDLARDRHLASESGVDLLFTPTAAEMYGAGADLHIAGGQVASRWEGAVRPGHFDGVLTIVAKLFNLVGPDIACFGQKDIQQVTLIRQMIREFNVPVRLLVSPIVREPDGLAMSSRNSYLSADERHSAVALSRALRAAEASWRAGESNADTLRDVVDHVLGRTPGLVADYIAIVEADALVPVARAEAGTIIALAVRVGRTRLIDNVILGAQDVARIK